MLDFFSMSFWQGALGNLLATLVGVIVGVPLALWINSHTSGKQKTERRIQLIKLLKQTLDKNKGLVEQMQREMAPNKVNFYNLDLSLLDTARSLKYELIDDLELNTELDNLTYELHHLQRKVELQLETAYSVFRSMGNFKDERTKLINAITSHLDNVLPLLISAQHKLSRLLQETQ